MYEHLNIWSELYENKVKWSQIGLRLRSDWVYKWGQCGWEQGQMCLRLRPDWVYTWGHGQMCLRLRPDWVYTCGHGQMCLKMSDVFKSEVRYVWN